MNLFSYGTLTVVIAVVGILLLLKLFFKPIKKIFKFLLHAVFGFLLLFLVNALGASVGVQLELSLVNCLVAGFIGIPGVLILLAINYLF